MGKFVLILGILLILFWPFWTPGIKVATDFHTSSAEYLANNIYPFTWKDSIASVGLGEYTINILWSQPLHSFFGILSLTNLSFEWVEKILGLLCLTGGFFSIWKLLSGLNIGSWGKFVGSFFYLTNTFFILLFDGGQMTLALGYAVLPITILFFLRNSIWFTFWLIILSILDIRLIYILGIILVIYIFYSLFVREKINLKRISFNVIFTSIILVGFHAYWLLPALLVRTPDLPQNYGNASQVDFLSFSTLTHSLFLQQPHWFLNSFGKISSPNPFFVLIPILVFSAFLKKKDSRVGFWLIIALLGIFLSKGSQEPLANIYSFLFTHIPGFSIFRDPVKFYFLTALAFSVLISISIDSVIEIKKLKKWIALFVIIYLVFLIRPIYIGWMTGMLSIPIYQKEYTDLKKLLIENNPAIVFWLPSKAPLGFSDQNYPSVDASRLVQKRPFMIGTKGTYENFNFLREAPFMGEIFDVSGIGYVVYSLLDPRRDDMHPDNIRYFVAFARQLAILPWLTKIDSPIPLYKTKVHQDKIFAAPNLWWVIGSDSIYNEATKSANLRLSKNGLIFVEEFPNLGKRLDEFPNSKIILNDKTLIDLAASFIEEDSFLFPASFLSFNPNQSGWWKRGAADLINWRAFLQEKYGIDNQDFDLGGGWAIGEGKLKLKVQSEKLKMKKNVMLLARVMESSRSGSLSFYQADQRLGKIETKITKDANVRWFEVGETVADNEDISIATSGDINVVNALVTINKDKWLEFKSRAENLKDRIVEFNSINNGDVNQPVIFYKRINPTKYIVDVSNLKAPALLVLSQNYDTLWKIDKKASLPVYSLLNGFSIDKDGQYIIEFEPQKWVGPGLIISFLSLVVFIFMLFKYGKSK